MPGFAVLLFLLEAGGAWLLWRWISKASTGIASDRAMASLSLFAIFALLLFLVGRFSVTIARLEDQRLLRPSASFLSAGAYVCAFIALGIAGAKTQWPSSDFWVARGLCVLLGLMAAEILVTLLLEIYRPRVSGKVTRPLYDSRVVGLLAQPESLFTTAAQTLDYQFGFKVSETWFFQLLKKNLPALLLAQFAVLFLSTCVVFVDAGEQAVLEHFGRPVATLDAGAHFKLPWPVEKIYRYRTEQIQTFIVGYVPDAQSEKANTVLWSTPHGKEDNFLVGNRAPVTVQNENADTNSTVKAPPVSLISVSIPVQFQITNVTEWAYNNADATNLLQSLATREVVRFLAGVDLNNVMSSNRLEAAETLRAGIQAVGERIQTWRENHFCRPAGHPSADDGGRRLRKGHRRGADEAGHDSGRAGLCHQQRRAGRGAGVHDHESRRRDAAATGSFAVRAGGFVHEPDSGVRSRAVRLQTACLFPDVRRRDPERPQIRPARHEHRGRPDF